MFTVISSIVYLWIISLYLNHFFILRHHSLIFKGMIWSIYYFTHFYLLNLFNNLILNFIGGYLLLLALSILLYKSNCKRYIFTTFFIYILGMVIESGVAIFLQNFGYSFTETFFTGSITSKLILLAIIHAMTIFKFQQSHNEPATFYWLLLFIATVVSILVIHTIFLFNRSIDSTFFHTLSSLCILALLFLNIALFIIYNKLSTATELKVKNIVLEEQLKYYDTLIENKKRQQTLFHQERHNIKNQLIALRTYAANNQNTEIISFITQLLGNEEFGLTAISCCDNILVDAIISSKIRLADKYNIHYDWDINIPAELPFADTDLCILLGNVLDNSFDANTTALPGVDNRFVSLSLQYKNDVLYCHTRNSFFHKLKPSSSAIFSSTKPDTNIHGYGLPSIKKVVSKYNGLTDITTADNIFSLKFTLYKP